jgi:hypothetical protein
VQGNSRLRWRCRAGLRASEKARHLILTARYRPGHAVKMQRPGSMCCPAFRVGIVARPGVRGPHLHQPARSLWARGSSRPTRGP